MLLVKQHLEEAVEICVAHARAFPLERDTVETVACHLARLIRRAIKEPTDE